ncbi:MAG: RsiV family protein [Candidatus Paceibacterota bacterium]
MRTRNNSNKGFYFIIVIIVVILVAYSYNQGWFGFLFQKEEVKNVEEKKKEENIEKKYELQTKTRKDEINGATIDVEYPYFNTSVDERIKEAIDAKVNDFKNSLSESIGTDQFLNISFFSSNYSRNIYSIKYTIIYSGGIHPIEDVQCNTYDLDKSKELQISDIFKEDSGYLNKLSELARAELLKDSDVDPSWAKEGTMPKSENFKNFTLDKENIIFYFAPGTVASNAAGIKEVKLHLSVLKYFLNNQLIN